MRARRRARAGSRRRGGSPCARACAGMSRHSANAARAAATARSTSSLVGIDDCAERLAGRGAADGDGARPLDACHAPPYQSVRWRGRRVSVGVGAECTIAIGFSPAWGGVASATTDTAREYSGQHAHVDHGDGAGANVGHRLLQRQRELGERCAPDRSLSRPGRARARPGPSAGRSCAVRSSDSPPAAREPAPCAPDAARR